MAVRGLAVQRIDVVALSHLGSGYSVFYEFLQLAIYNNDVIDMDLVIAAEVGILKIFATEDSQRVAGISIFDVVGGIAMLDT